MEKKNNLKVNYIYNLTYQILLLFTPLITTPYLSRVLGTDGIGKFSYTQSIVMYFTICGSLGANLYGQREIAYVSKDKQIRSKRFFEIFILKLIFLSISLVIYYSTFAINGRYPLLFMIQCIDLFAAIFDITWFFQGLEEFRKTVTRNVIIKFISILLIFIFVKDSSDLTTFYFCHAGTIVLSNISLWFYLPKFLLKVNINFRYTFSHLPSLIALFIPQAAIQVYSLLDKTMIGDITKSTYELANYEQSQKLVNLCLTVVTSIATVMLPRIASVYAEKRSTDLHNYMVKTFRYSWMLAAPIFIGLITTIKNMSIWFFGTQYDKVPMIVWIISPIILFTNISTILGNQFMVATKRQKQYSLSILLGAISNVLMNIILIKYYGAIGAALASVISSIIIVLFDIIYLRKEISYKDIFYPARKYLLLSLFMGIFVCLLGELQVSILLKTFLQLVVGTSIYILSLILLRDRLVMDILNKILMKFRH